MARAWKIMAFSRADRRLGGNRRPNFDRAANQFFEFGAAFSQAGNNIIPLPLIADLGVNAGDRWKDLVHTHAEP